jgi:hypothetical protein
VPQLAERPIENRLLRRHEPLEIKLVGHLNDSPSGFAADAIMRSLHLHFSIRVGT